MAIYFCLWFGFAKINKLTMLCTPRKSLCNWTVFAAKLISNFLKMSERKWKNRQTWNAIFDLFTAWCGYFFSTLKQKSMVKNLPDKRTSYEVKINPSNNTHSDFQQTNVKYSEILLLRPSKTNTSYLLKTLFAKFKLFFSSFSTPSEHLIRDQMFEYGISCLSIFPFSIRHF